MSQQSVVYVRPPTNGLGLAGFIVSVVGWFSCGLLCPIGLILSILGLARQPRGFAIAGVILGALGSFWGIIAFFFGGIALLIGCGGVLCGGVAPQVVTEVRMNIVADDVEKFFDKNGRMPASVTEAMSVRKRHHGEEKDAWGNPFRLDVTGNRQFSISSDGADRIAGTSDDRKNFYSHSAR